MGVPQLADLVLETANAPGTGAFTLGGAPDGRQTFADAFPNGGDVYYYASDGVQSEWGVGTLTVGSPNVLVRKTIIGNLFGTTSALNFTSGVTVYCEVPAKKMPSLDDDGQLPVSGSPDFTRDVAVSAKAADGRYLRLSDTDTQTVSGPVTFSGENTHRGAETHSGAVTFTGNLSKDAPVGSNSQIQITAGGSERWNFGRDGAAESDTSTGSNFVIARFDNSGNYIDSPFGINRNTGVASANIGMVVPNITDFTGLNALNAKTAEDRYVKSVPATGQTRITDLVENSDGRAVFGDGTNNPVLANLSDVTTAGTITGGTYTKTPMNDGTGRSVLTQYFVVQAKDADIISFPMQFSDANVQLNLTSQYDNTGNGGSAIANFIDGTLTSSSFQLDTRQVWNGGNGGNSTDNKINVTATGIVS